jgi:hypothetical protein
MDVEPGGAALAELAVEPVRDEPLGALAPAARAQRLQSAAQRLAPAREGIGELRRSDAELGGRLGGDLPASATSATASACRELSSGIAAPSARVAARGWTGPAGRTGIRRRGARSIEGAE